MSLCISLPWLQSLRVPDSAEVRSSNGNDLVALFPGAQRSPGLTAPPVLQMASDQLVASTQLCLHRKLRNRRTQSKSINIRKANSISWLKISYIYRPDMSRAQVKGPRDEICLKRPRLSRAKDLKTNALLYLYILILYTLYCFWC